MQIRIFEWQDGWPVRVAAVSETGRGSGRGTAPVLVNLETYQQKLGRAQINQILIANRGGRASVERSGGGERRIARGAGGSGGGGR
ncbi:MAG: hypothetical protein U0232_15770 [Thermomicrobiales bacterium]